MLATKTIPRLPMSILLRRKRLRWRFLKGNKGTTRANAAASEERSAPRGVARHGWRRAKRVSSGSGHAVGRSRTPRPEADSSGDETEALQTPVERPTAEAESRSRSRLVTFRAPQGVYDCLLLDFNERLGR